MNTELTIPNVGNEIETLLKVIAQRAKLVNVYTPPGRSAAVASILEGIVHWLTDEPTIQAGIVEDLARMIEQCGDREELRDLSVQLREMALAFEPDASRVALTENEARVLDAIDEAARAARLFVQVGDDEPMVMSLDEFVDANPEALDSQDIAALTAGGEVFFGGGAAPRVRVVKRNLSRFLV